MHYWQHPSMRDQNYNSDEFYPIIVESLAHQYPPRQQQPTYNQQVLSGVPDDHQISDALTTGASGRYSTPPLYLRRCYDNEHSTVRLQAKRYAKQKPDSLKQGGFCEPTATAHQPTVSTTISYRRPLQQSENQPFDEEYATSRANQLTERDFSGSFALPPTYTNQNSQKQHINPSQSRTKDTHRKTSTTSPNPPSTNPNLPLPTSSHVLQLPSSCPQRTHFEVANTREEGSDGEKAGERAEKVAADFQSSSTTTMILTSSINSEEQRHPVEQDATTAAGQLSITVTVNSDATCRTITLSVDSAFTETSETLTLTKMDSWPCQAARSPLLQMEELSRSVTGGQLSITSTIFSDSSATANGAALFLDPSGLTASQLTSLLPRTSMCVDDLAFSKLIVVLPSTLSSASVGSLISPTASLTIFPSSENARSPRDPPHMTAEGSRFHVHPNSHLQYLNTQRITHVVICGTGTTFLASPAKHVSPLQLVSGACDGSDVAEPADSDEGIVCSGVEEACWSD
ncbi:hypothetical protein BLNAU_24417 [Blattamonas nauphoetae]|uniref:Uncharacterized protein n=1 Tax=Blattamonas nauphoetae TaxID=2049346 RepID=A0ABQ9WMH7_9EUKA|nr:hypothetical protein BLNAU_24417 [Blattamonas nauphoetae]